MFLARACWKKKFKTFCKVWTQLDPILLNIINVVEVVPGNKTPFISRAQTSKAQNWKLCVHGVRFKRRTVVYTRHGGDVAVKQYATMYGSRTSPIIRGFRDSGKHKYRNNNIKIYSFYSFCRSLRIIFDNIPFHNNLHTHTQTHFVGCRFRTTW